MKPWLTFHEAALITGRSKRTLRRWVAAHLVVIREENDTTLLLAADVIAVEAQKTGYRRHPTFARSPEGR
ncbi:hypothetical protein HII28_02100 [Planctomonas sp. JC2975]|uniref:hypothetical protein n=1 Tax=Planctomonas sp. JC2975 TaxID=2729626 RepID=UPI0014760D1E|nr:hypothetical protein [Planctomonas sp. JC2975]NNC10679.1 hypothetical protein [Planctomonas sp. JC2975]